MKLAELQERLTGMNDREKRAWLGSALSTAGKVLGTGAKLGFGALSGYGAYQGLADTIHSARGIVHGDPEGRTRGESVKRMIGSAAMVPLNLAFMVGKSPVNAMLNKFVTKKPFAGRGVLDFGANMALFSAAGALQQPASFRARQEQQQRQQQQQQQQYVNGGQHAV